MPSKTETPKIDIKFQDVLKQAVSEPGKIMAAYRAFHGYSFGNQLLAMFQCSARGIPIGPIATFKSWQEKGRNVKKGAKAIALCMPVTIKKEDDKNPDESKTFTKFQFRNKWFVLDQTEGAPFEIPALDAWNQESALKALGLELVPFNHPSGNVQGYATENKVAVNPLAQLPLKTLFHELGHVVLGHTQTTIHDETSVPKNIMEVEAESVALLCLSALNLPGSEFCRGYIQSWLNDSEIPEKSCQKIMAAADKILKAGTPSKGVQS